MTTSIYAWSTDAAANATADGSINWSEFQAPDTVNNSARQVMGRVAEVLKDFTPTRTSAGSGNAYTVSTTSAMTALVDGTVVYFYADKTNTGTSTLACNAFGAKPLRAKTGTPLTGNEILAGTVVGAFYRLAGDEWIITNSGYHTNVLVPGLLSSSLVTLKPGSVLAWPTATIPTGWLECNGAAVSRTTYSQLFTALGTTYGTGDGSTTFNLPDYRGEFLRGQDGGIARDADRASRTTRGDGTTGDNVGTKQAADTVAHTHGPGTLAGTTNTTGAHTHSGSFGGSDQAGAGTSRTVITPGTSSTTSNGDHSHTVTLASGVSASTGGTETRPRNVYVKYIILALPAAAAASTLGVNGLLYTWDTGTTAADPGSGKLRVNNATLSSATALYISETGADSAGYGGLIGTWDDSSSTVKGTLHWYKVGDLDTYAIYQVTGTITDSGDYRAVTLTHVASAGTFSADDQLSVLFHRTGDIGSTGTAGDPGIAGAAGPNVGLDYQWNTATSGDPGSGKVLVNNATPASATAIHISETNRLSAAQGPFIATWDDSTTSGNKGVLRIVDVSAAGTNFLEYQITGSLTDAGGYDTFPVTYVGGAGTLTNDLQISVAFYRAGDKGTDGAGAGDVVGPAASIDSEIALYDSTTGKLLKRATTTGILKGTSGVLSAATAGTDYVAPGGALGTPSSGTLTNATGLPVASGISGLGTGVATALAVNVGSAGAPVTFNGALGTPSSGTLTNATGLPASGLVASTSQAVGFGTVELGHASDTTLSRSAAGELAVEGTVVKKVGKETICLPASAWTIGASGSPPSATVELAAGTDYLSVLDYDGGGSTEYAYATVTFPKSWNNGTITFIVKGFSGSATSTVARFGLSGAAVSTGEAVAVTYGTAQYVTVTNGGTANRLLFSSESSAITIGSTPSTGDTIRLRCERTSGNAADTMTEDFRKAEVIVFFTTNASTDA